MLSFLQIQTDLKWKLQYVSKLMVAGITKKKKNEKIYWKWLK